MMRVKDRCWIYRPLNQCNYTDPKGFELDLFVSESGKPLGSRQGT